jgi:hypothetical protein
MVDGLRGWPQVAINPIGMPRIRVAVKAREVGRRDLQPDAMPLAEDIAGDADIDGVFVNLVRFQQFRLVKALAVAGADDAVTESAAYATLRSSCGSRCSGRCAR